MNAADKPWGPPARPGVRALPLTLAELAAYDAVIDVRTPAEFAEDHLPHAINLPVLSNEERVTVGTLHKQASAFEAKKVGAALVARNIARHIEDTLKGHGRDWRPLVYCWRGGMRSGAMAHILRSVGWSAFQLEGGYKAWRGQLLAELDTLPARFHYEVVCGRTGSGKSRLLEALDAAGRQVLDLERLAAHKGSVLGDLPDAPQPSQKRFDSLVWEALSRFDPARPVYVEAESKKVGLVQVPDTLMAAMRASPCIEVVTPDALRVTLLTEEYAHLIAHPSRLFDKLDALVRLHSRDKVEAWKDLARAGRWTDFVADMLVTHYDPAYGRSMFSNYTGASRARPLAVDDISGASFERLAHALPA